MSVKLQCEVCLVRFFSEQGQIAHECTGVVQAWTEDVLAKGEWMSNIEDEAWELGQQLRQRIDIAEDARFRAEQDMLKYREECNSMRRELNELRHASPRRIGGTFRKRDRFPIEHELIREVIPPGSYDEYRWKWSRGALYAGLGSGMYTTLEGQRWCGLPRQVKADSWWHVCAKLGLTEGVARICYFHPEEGQESAVAKVKSIRQGPVISCQGDWVE